jgi:aspartyl-tRNA(Asn)/glutamyl-tRNA(Gln) amidotransferase subunit C
MVLGRDLVKRLADLASLELQEPEVVRIAADLERILGHVACLQEAELEEIGGAEAAAPGGAVMAQAGPAALRPDDPAPSLPREVALAQAPRANEEGFVVPRFVDGG